MRKLVGLCSQMMGALIFIVSAYAHAESTAYYHYEGEITLIAEQGYLKADWRIAILDGAETSMTFFVRNTVENVTVSGADIKRHSIATTEENLPFHHIEIELNPQQGDEARIVRISYDGVLLPEPLENRINTIQTDYIELTIDSFWHPVDSRFDKRLTASLDINIGEGWTGLTTGDLSPTENGARIKNETPALDIPFSFSRSFKVYPYDTFTLYDHRTDSTGIPELAAAAQNCIAYLNDQFGDQSPIPVGRFLVTTRESSGYSRRNYIAFTNISETEPERLTQFVCHELAHFWSRGGNFGTVENWLNESFADYVANMALRKIYGIDVFADRMQQYAEQIEGKELPAIWEENGDRERRPYLVNYRKGPLLLERLENHIGEDKFHAFLYRYMVGGINTTPELIEALSDVAGSGARDWFVDALAE